MDKRVALDVGAVHALEVTEENRPAILTSTELGNLTAHERFAAFLLTGKKWQTGQELPIYFYDGEPQVNEKIRHYAEQWMQYANIKLVWVDDYRESIVRITQDKSDGSWSYIGTDTRAIPQGQATMNFGWLEKDTDDQEYSRVVLHEFGHLLGMPHEHNHPHAGIPWDRAKVYAYYGAPPNNWSKEDVDNNLFAVYEESNTSFDAFDKKSIMLYAIPNELTIGDYAVGWNTTLSEEDKTFIGRQYPYPVEKKPEVPRITITRFALKKNVTQDYVVTRSGRDWASAGPVK